MGSVASPAIYGTGTVFGQLKAESVLWAGCESTVPVSVGAITETKFLPSFQIIPNACCRFKNQGFHIMKKLRIPIRFAISGVENW